MAKGFAASEQIERPADEVWRFLVDWDAMPRWMKGVDRIQPVQDGSGPIGEGTRLVFRARGAERESTIVGWEPGQRLALRSVQGGISAVYDYRISGDGQRTTISLDAECRATGLFWKAMRPLISFAMKRSDGGQLKAFKAAIEAAIEAG